MQPSPDRSHLLLLERPVLPPIAELAAPEMRLAGLRINPRIYGRSRAASFDGLRLVAVGDGAERRVAGLPADPRTRNVAWAPERLFNALKGMGKTTRLVMFPHESHGYRGKESVMHMLWEMDRWLERYVKNAKTEQ